MDTLLSPSSVGDHWCGLVRTSHDETRTLAHRQAIKVDASLPCDCTIMIYMAVVDFKDKLFHLSFVEATQFVIIPEDNSRNFKEMKEVCSGIGSMSMAAEFLGSKVLAAMDINDKMIHTMRSNGGTQAIRGDITNVLDRHLLHISPRASRGILASGFPCQPLSQQGDQTGSADCRSKPFYATVRIAWEQQMSALLLECVPGALTASYVQEELQRLAYSLGCDLHQRILNLSNFWPCSRSRWWCLIVPREIQIPHLPDLMYNAAMQRIDSLFPVWPVWPKEIEEELLLTEEEIDMFSDKTLGTDMRRLQMNRQCPCILHSYGNLRTECPCGCRADAMSWQRLQKGGARGFYVMSQLLGEPRYLTTVEASALLTIPTTLEYESQKLGLCLLGQSAAPAQARVVQAPN